MSSIEQFEGVTGITAPPQEGVSNPNPSIPEGDPNTSAPDANLPPGFLPPSLAEGSLAEWALTKLREGRSLSWIEANMESHPEFKRRFPAIERIREQGLSPPSLEQYVAYERQVAQVAAQIDSPLDTSRETVADLLANHVSLQQVQRFPSLRSELRTMGLEENLTQWAWGQLSSGRSIDQVQFDMQDTTSFRERFPAIHQMRQQGLNPPSPERYMQVESNVRQIVNRFDLPADEFANRDRITQLLVNRKSPNELNDDLESLSSQILAQSDEIRQFYSTNFGDGDFSDGAILASAFDGTRPPHEFERKIRASRVGGAADEFGFDRGPERAQELTERGVGLEQARELFSNARTQVPQFSTLASRHNDPDDEFDLRDFEQAMVFGDPDQQRRMERLLGQEQAQFSPGASFRADQQGALVGLRQR